MRHAAVLHPLFLCSSRLSLNASFAPPSTPVGAPNRGIPVVIYFTTNPFFETIRPQHATTLRIGEIEVSGATVEGLIALHLYALHLLTRQREYYRRDRYERDVITLLSRNHVRDKSILEILRPQIPEHHMTELKDTLKACRNYSSKRWPAT